MADQCIGKLYLDISQVKKDIAEVNEFLGKIGANVNISDKIEEKIASAMRKLVNEAKKAGEEAGKAIKEGMSADVEPKALEKAIQQMKEYYSLMAKAQNATNSGRGVQASYYTKEAQEILKAVGALREQAEATEAVAKARRTYNASVAAGTDKQLAQHTKEAAQAAKEHEKAEKERAKAIEQSAMARERAQQLLDNEAMAEEQRVLEALINLYVKKAQMDTEATKAVAAGNIDNANLYLQEEAAIDSLIKTIARLYPELDKLAKGHERVADAELKREAAANTAKQKASEIDYKQRTQDINAYADALKVLYDRQTELAQRMATGEIQQGTEEYERLQMSIKDAGARVQELGEKIGESGRKEATEIDRVVAAQERLRKVQEEIASGGNLTYLERAQIAYSNLRNAIENYHIAQNNGNANDQSYWQQQITATMLEVEAIKQAVNATSMEAAEKSKVLGYIQQCETAQLKANTETEQASSITRAIGSQVSGLVTRYIGLYAIIRSITSLIKNAIEYVSEYSNKMSEIQIITGKTNSEVQKLAETYRNIAQDMGVSSLDIADAAIYFTRQGLAAEQIEERLKNTTMFAKAANVEFETAAELITAVVNSMGLVEQEAEDGRAAAQRVADVFLAVGDSAATSGEEIGEAMQKAAASAGTFGVSFEWLASYIATVSETTRQEARTIGTAFNTIIARLHQIKQSGYNSEDETRVNDVAKALDKINVELMTQDKEWRDITDVFLDVAKVWNTLDDKQKSYIATTMAGVKQQNVFYALMNDLSKGITNQSRAIELYNIAMDSAGTATKKYGAYLESVEAAHNRLTISWEQFYSMLNDSVIKDTYNFIAQAISEITTAIKGTGEIEKLNKTISDTSERITYFEKMQKIVSDVFNSIGTEVGGVTTTVDDYTKELEMIKQISPGVAEVVGKLQDGLISQGDAFKYINSEIVKYMQLASRSNLGALASKWFQWEPEELPAGIGQLNLMQKAGYTENNAESFADVIEDYYRYRIQEHIDFWSRSLLERMTYISPAEYGYFGNGQFDMSPNVTALVANIHDAFEEITGVDFQTALEQELNVSSGQWELIGQLVWSKIFDGSADYGASFIMDQITTAVEEVANGDYPFATDTQRREIRDYLLYNIIGRDMDATYEEYEAMGAVIGNFISKVADYGLEAALPNNEIALMIAEKFFNFDTIAPAIQNAFLNQGDDVFKQIIENYYNLISKGFTDADIQSYLGDTSVMELVNSLDIISQGIRERVADAYRNEAGESLIWNLFGADFETLNLDTLLMLDNLAKMGVTIQQIEEAAEGATSLEEMIENISVLQKTGAAAPSEDDVKKWSSYIKDIKEANSEIENLEGIISNRKEKKAVSDSDWLGIISSHPDMIGMINDVEALEGKLEELKAARDALVREMVMNSTDLFDSTKWANEVDENDNKFITLKQYREYLKDNKLDLTEVDAYIEKATQSAEVAEETAKSTASEFEKLITQIKNSESELSKIDSLLETIKGGKDVKLSDLLDLAQSHPELLAAANDLEALKKALEDIKGADVDQFEANFRKMILDSEEVAKNSPFASMLDPKNGIKTLRDLSTDENIGFIEDYLYQVMATFMNATGMLEDAGSTLTEAFINALFPDASMDLMNRKMISAEEMLAAGWKNFKDDIATVYSSTYTAGEEGLAWNQNIVMNLTPITPDGKVLTPDELDKYVEDLLAKSANMEELFKNDAEGLNLLINVSAVAEDESFDDAVAKAESLMELLHKIHEYMYGKDESEKSWLQQTVEAANQAAEENWAKSNNYIEQISAMQEAIANGNGASALEIWNNYDASMRKSIAETYPELAAAMYEVEKAIGDTNDEMDDSEDKTEKLKKATDKLSSALQKSSKYATAKNFTSTYEAIRKLEKGTISATDAYETFNKELDTVKKAGEDITDVNEKMAAGTEVTVSDVSNLAKVLGMSAEEILQDWPNAVQAFDDMTGAAGELQAVFDELNKAAFIRITGVSEADFSNITNGLLSVQGMAEETIDMLIATGQWELDKIPLNGMVSVLENGKLVQKYLTGYQSVLKATGNNPYKGRGGSTTTDTKTNKGGGGGGGGGGDKSSNEMTEVERMLDRMSQVYDIQEYQQSFYSAQKGYYSQTGELQGVIAYINREIDALNEQNGTLESNIQKIEEYMAAKKAELDTMDITDEEYKTVADDLDKLQEAHQKYTKELISNKTSLESLTEAIQEQQDKIRKMEIDLRNTILKAIQDREKRAEDMLNGEIEMENTILDLIQKRYEKERDQIIETNQLKIDSLQKERDLLSEQLQLRKQQAEEEDKAKQLAQYEAQYQRILADPTRRKEAMELYKKIHDLRDEMAWDAAEKEVKSQQDSIDQQVESLEDYIEYVQNYYEDLFEHPQKLIEEMKSIITKTDEEIIEWLKANDEEYAKSTENTQKTMVQSWQDTLDQMHDVLKTYWDEIEFIIEQGDEYIINFLKENSADYREAGKLQAEAYVDEWKKQLSDLEKAHRQVVAEIADSYAVIEQASSESSKKGGGSDGSGNGGDDSGNTETTEVKKYWHVHGVDPQKRKTVMGATYDTKEAAESAAKKAEQYYGWSDTKVSYYKNGGIANKTGLVWIDGTMEEPERILSPYQTKLFETMVDALDSISRISVPGMSNYGDVQKTGGGSVSVGDIVVNVDNLDTDDDYEELAEKVSAVLMERIGRTAAIGGLHIRSI